MSLMVYVVPFVTREEYSLVNYHEDYEEYRRSIPTKEELIVFYGRYGLKQDDSLKIKMTLEL